MHKLQLKVWSNIYKKKQQLLVTRREIIEFYFPAIQLALSIHMSITFFIDKLCFYKIYKENIYIYKY